MKPYLLEVVYLLFRKINITYVFVLMLSYKFSNVQNTNYSKSCLLLCLIIFINGCVINIVPEFATNSETNGTPFIVMLHVINLHHLPPTTFFWTAVMQEIVHHVVHDIADEESTVEKVKCIRWHNHSLWKIAENS